MRAAQCFRAHARLFVLFSLCAILVFSTHSAAQLVIGVGDAVDETSAVYYRQLTPNGGWAELFSGEIDSDFPVAVLATMAVDDDRGLLYAQLDNLRVYTARINNGHSPPLRFTYQDTLDRLYTGLTFDANSDDLIGCIIVGSSTEFWRISTNNYAESLIGTNNQIQLRGLAFDNTYVVGADQTNQQVVRVSLSSPGTREVFPSSGFPNGDTEVEGLAFRRGGARPAFLVNADGTQGVYVYVSDDQEYGTTIDPVPYNQVAFVCAVYSNEFSLVREDDDDEILGVDPAIFYVYGAITIIVLVVACGSFACSQVKSLLCGKRRKIQSKKPRQAWKRQKTAVQNKVYSSIGKSFGKTVKKSRPAVNVDTYDYDKYAEDQQQRNAENADDDVEAGPPPSAPPAQAVGMGMAPSAPPMDDVNIHTEPTTGGSSDSSDDESSSNSEGGKKRKDRNLSSGSDSDDESTDESMI